MEEDFKKEIEAFFTGTKVSRDFATDVMIPRLEGLLKLSKKDKIIVSIYYRMFLWINSLVILNQIRCFQAVAAGTRSIFELLLDLKLIIENKINNAVEKYYVFTDIERARVAKDLVDYLEIHKDSKIKTKVYKDFLNGDGEKKKIDALIVKYWGMDKDGQPKKIKHWSGWSVKTRAEKFEGIYYEFYLQSYPLLSWHLHSVAGAGYQRVDEKGFRTLYGTSHRLAHQMFIEATVLVAKEFHYYKVEPSFREWIEQIRLVPGLELLRKHRKEFNTQGNQAVSR
ncbi:MAG: DUF5677 domain-containing protein [Candidatus Omnitrophota bacterium]